MNSRAGRREIKLAFCDTFAGETQHKLLLTPDREPKTDQSNDYTGVQLGERVSLFRLLTGVLVRHYLDETSQRQLHY